MAHTERKPTKIHSQKNTGTQHEITAGFCQSFNTKYHILTSFIEHFGESVDLVTNSEIMKSCSKLQSEVTLGNKQCVPVYQSGTTVAYLVSKAPEKSLRFLSDVLGIFFDSGSKDQMKNIISVDMLQTSEDSDLYKCLLKDSLTDPLTGLLNRRGAKSKIKCLLASGAINMGLIMLDIDYFKEINDTLGHCAGDQTLQEVGTILKGNCRVSDIVVRWGGDEFLMMLPNCDQKDAKSIAEAIHHSVEYESTSTWMSMCTVSIGVATKLVTSSKCVDVLVGCADNALYNAKKAGKNCVKGHFTPP